MNIFLKKMEIIDEISESIDFNLSKKIIESFAYVLWSTRKNFHYNETYLTDFEYEYFNFLDNYRKKKKFLEEIVDRVNREVDVFFIKLVLLYDDLWLFEYQGNQKDFEFYKDGNIDRIMNKKVYIHLRLEHINNQVIDNYFELDIDKKSINVLLSKVKELIKIIKESTDE